MKKASYVLLIALTAMITSCFGQTARNSSLDESHMEGHIVPVESLSIYRAFYDTLQNAIAEYGISLSCNPNSEGMRSAWLIDFNNDGMPALMFNRSVDYGFGVLYFVYGYSHDAAELWFTGLATPFNTAPNTFSIAVNDSGKKYLMEFGIHTWSTWCYYHSFANGESVLALGRHSILEYIETEDGEWVYKTNYYVNENATCHEIFMNAPQSKLGIIAQYRPDYSHSSVLDMLGRLRGETE